MPNEVLATEMLAPPPEVALSEPDYRAFCAALEASARGRAFLADYARRNRHANTEILLAALDRLETLVRSQSATARAPSALPPEVAALVMVDKELAVEAVRSHLAVVPRADEPELPIPAPAGGPAPAIALVHDPEKWEPVFGQDHAQTKHVQAAAIAQSEPEVAPPVQGITQRSAAIIPEINLFDGAPVKPATAEPEVQDVLPEPIQPPLIPAQAGIQESNQRSEEGGTGSPLARGRAVELPTADPLAHIMALSDEERLALFS